MMKAKIVSTVPRSRFELFKVEIPDQWEVDFVDYPLPEEALIEALRDADFCWSVRFIMSAAPLFMPPLVKNDPHRGRRL